MSPDSGILGGAPEDGHWIRKEMCIYPSGATILRLQENLERELSRPAVIPLSGCLYGERSERAMQPRLVTRACYREVYEHRISKSFSVF